jgi:MerR family transcriptional regulator, light-induced transcriptional regulator
MRKSASDRFALAQKLASIKQDVVRAISEQFFANHPDWVVRYGDLGRQFWTEDVCFHVEFLAGAIEAGSPEAFADYARWSARMLGARGIAADTLDESFAQLEKHLSVVLLPEECESVLRFLARGRAACAKEAEPAPDDSGSAEGLGLSRQVFLAAILSGKRKAALTIVEEALRAGHSHVDIYADVFTEALHRVGELWEMNKISVAQEHIATSITQYAIAAIYPTLVPAAVHRGNMVVTGVAGELHQIGANLVADAMEASGWKVRFLGTNLPPSSVLATVEEISADVLCISTTIVANLPSVVDLVRTVRGKLKGFAPEIVLGGGAYRVATRFARDIGATGVVTDLRQALAMFCP